jgi:hypothetical protein
MSAALAIFTAVTLNSLLYRCFLIRPVDRSQRLTPRIGHPLNR